ncbi:hypothetical protein CRX72_24575 [Pantoea sp. BRM17]|nr:hypothetical protein CRX72_24575 [Pantoea sp. BRM17]
MVAGLDAHDVECQAPGSQHIFYVYSGKWHGPAGLMPSDDTLKSWTISKIVWQRAISQALNNDYQLRQGMRSEQGEVAEFWQALQDGKVKLIISGKPTVERIEVLDATAESSSGSKIGDRAALAAALAVSGCATTGQAPAEHESHWYNPLTYHWAALNPLSWFGGSLQVTEQGVAGLNGSTLMSESGRERSGRGIL